MGFLRELDEKIFVALASQVSNTPLRAISPWIGTLYFWIPVLVFLLLLVLLYRPRQAALNILFGLGSYIIAYQIAIILGRITQIKPPYLLAVDDQGILPAAYGQEHYYAFPDWQITSLIAVHAFLVIRGRAMGMRLTWLAGAYLWVFALARTAAGYCFPSGMLMGAMLGVLVGWFCARVARNIDLLSPQTEGPAVAAPAESEARNPAPEPEPVDSDQ